MIAGGCLLNVDWAIVTSELPAGIVEVQVEVFAAQPWAKADATLSAEICVMVFSNKSWPLSTTSDTMPSNTPLPNNIATKTITAPRCEFRRCLRLSLSFWLIPWLSLWPTRLAK